MTFVEKIDVKFASIADAVERFATTRGFRLGKCLRGNSGWELSRNHADGGSITLLLLYDDELGLGIGSNWQFPS